MASVLKLKTDIKKLKAAIASKATSAAIKTKLRGKLTSLENELDKLQPKKRKPKTTGPKSESALVRLAKKRRNNQGLSTSKNDIERDAIRPALPSGKRTSASGNVYYEYRDNRIDNRQPPKKYRKLADGGNTSDFDKLIADKFKMNDELDYAEDLKDFIIEKYKGKSVDGYELRYGTSDGGTPWVWVLTNKNIDLFAEPFVDSLDDGIIVEAYENEDELINRHEIPFKLTGDFEKDSEKYIKLLKPYFKKYASGKKPKVKPVTIDVEAVKKREHDIEIAEQIGDIVDGFGWGIYKVGARFEFDFQKLLQEVKAKKIKKGDLKNLETLQGTIEWKNEVLSKFGNIMSKKEREKLEKHDGRSVYADGGKTQGYDDKKDESLGMTRGKLSLKDFVGNRKQKEHSRRDDARFEERGKMADGGGVDKYLTENEYIKIEKKLDELYGKNVDKNYIHIYDLWAAYTELPEKDHESPFYKETEMVEALVNTFEEHGWNVDMPHGRYNVKEGYKFKGGGYMAKGGKTKDQEVVRGYFEDEAYEYGKGGKTKSFYEVVYVDRDDSKKVVAKFLDKNEAYASANALMEEMSKVGKTGIYKVAENTTSKFKDGGYMADGGSVAKGNYEMLMSQAKEIMHHAEELMQVAKPNMDVEAWVVGKAERATTDLSDITHYLDGLKMAMGGMVKHNAHKVNG
jgi:hypothetical protein